MKKTILLLLACASILGSCKKSDSGGGGIAGGDFTIGGTNYKVTSTMKLISGKVVGYTFTSLNMQTYANAAVDFYFAGNTTPAAGTYTIVDGYNSQNLTANQIGFIATSTTSSSQTTSYEPNNGGTAQVTVSGDKVSIVINSISMTTSPAGSSTISANVGEMQ
ncbi:MAG: hypothetical protein JST06_10950 [Bacteroidetes bacterium]|nr:hypothetical protein [Bacteroidota bacterium]MBS1630340.1 hypothetical protein [Bacteroidota bacterium]